MVWVLVVAVVDQIYLVMVLQVVQAVHLEVAVAVAVQPLLETLQVQAV
jgi:hypothetical protein